ncbi:TIGR04219 family outer membrane beta-barrel protein [Bacterioplanoides pacificum]|uniref:TIGR04219 family outer membrane beta-barrel protein n=1 Tax=Bacterioplanoides pacificum TaxID=1171596 RepID=A0ABV7VNK0_9GAMM
MKKTAIAALLAALTPMAAQADLLFTVGAKASIWNAEPSGQLDDGVSVESDGLNLDSDNGQQLTLYFEHPLPFIPNLQLKKTALELEGDGFINAKFGDKPFSEDVTSTFDLSHTDLTMIWGVPLPVPFVDVNFGLTARQFDGVAEVTSKTNSQKNEPVDLDFVMPLLYGEVEVNTPFGVYGQVDVNYIGYGDNKMKDLSYGIGYDLPIPVVDLGLEAGYRSLTLQTDEDLADIETDVEVKGAYFGANFAVGF